MVDERRGRWLQGMPASMPAERHSASATKSAQLILVECRLKLCTALASEVRFAARKSAKAGVLTNHLTTIQLRAQLLDGVLRVNKTQHRLESYSDLAML